MRFRGVGRRGLAMGMMRGGGASIVYLLRDLFTTDRAAGAVNGTAAEPGPGTRTVADSASKLSIATGRLVSAGGKAAPGWGDPRLVFSGVTFTRRAGLMAHLSFTPTAAATNGAIVGWFQTNSPTSNVENGWRYGLSGGATLTPAEAGGVAPATATHTLTGPVDLMTILRTAGAFEVLYNGTNAILHWVHNSRNQATVYAGVSNFDGQFSLDDFNVAQLPAPWTDDYGIVTQRLAGARSAGDLFSHTVDCLIEFVATTLPVDGSGAIWIYFRYRDDTNHWRINISNTGAIVLYECTDNVVTNRGAGAGVVAGHRIVVIADGQIIKVYANNVLKITYNTAAANLTETAGKVTQLGAGSAISDIASWPRYLTGTALQWLTPFFLISPVDVRDYGAHTTDEPGYEAFDSTTAFQAAINAANLVVITKPGTYLLNDTLVIPSNRTIRGVTGVILKRGQVYPFMIKNSAAWLGGAQRNTTITLSDLTFDDNNLGSQIGGWPDNGIINFRYMTGLTLENITIINGDTTLYGIHLQDTANAIVTNYTYTGGKDGFHLGAGCDSITLDGFNISSLDDALVLIGSDYPRAQGGAADIQNITIKNGTSQPHADQTGFFLRFITGSWLDWAAGNTYDIGHLCNNAGQIYKKINADAQVAANAPTHTSGVATGADGIQWRWLAAGTYHTTNIRNVTVKNVTIADGRSIRRITESNTYNHTDYPGTENTSILDEFHTDLSQAEAGWSNTGLLGNVYWEEP